MSLKPPTKPKIAFIGWNPFQLIHVTALIQGIPGSVFILENKHNSLANFDKSLLEKKDVPVLISRSKDIHKLDGAYDVIVCQTVFTGIHKFEKTKIAMIQYGYAKEAHNYGPWRSLADVCFTYGPYASQKISYFCPTVDIGYLRQDEIHNKNTINLAKKKYSHLLQPNKKTILYLPTWGKYNSSKLYLEEILSLKNEFNVIIKEHHNTDLLNLKPSQTTKHNPKFLGANDDAIQLILLSDIIISDYSGAIFDAIFCKKPVVLLNSKHTFKNHSEKVDKYSIEYQQRNNLGYVVKSSKDLEKYIKKTLYENNSCVSNNLYRKLFSNTVNPSKIINEELVKLSKSESIKLSQQQLYIRRDIKMLYAKKYESIKYNIYNSLYSMYAKVMKTKTHT